ncbi:MAG: 4Fe-4S binding protein [Candidatus Odinarchaeota archaeon]
MILQSFDDWVQSLYFPHINNIILVILSFVILISVGLLAVILLRNQKLNNNLKIVLLSISFIFGGIILGGVPNVVLVIQHIFADFIYPNRWVFLLIRLSIFLGLTLFFGRVFCGYVCPLGAIQELVSMVRFKSKLDYDRKFWKKKNYLRWGFFTAYAIFSIIWGLKLTLFMNPINGFLIFWTPLNLVIFIAFIIFLLTIFISIFIYRPYCRFFCPFGALAFLFGKVSPLKIRRTPYCTECGICEKICPTLEGFDYSEKGECYYCYRCIDFCTNEMFIDTGKIAQINRLLTTYSLDFDSISKEKYFDKIFKNIIRLLIPYKRTSALEQLSDALKGKKDMSLDAIQNIVIRLKAIFPEEIKKLDIVKYKTWIVQNESKWKDKIEPIHLDKLFYGLKKETQ